MLILFVELLKFLLTAKLAGSRSSITLLNIIVILLLCCGPSSSSSLLLYSLH